jgi:4-nitrophenyl phosphatase
MSVTYTKLAKAFQHLLQNDDCAFIATNEDSTYPATGGLLPGAGSVFAPLQTALGGRKPIAIGKPNKTMLDCIKAKWASRPLILDYSWAAVNRHDFDPARTLMVGDRLNTDIAFGQAGGLSTLLVLTGL